MLCMTKPMNELVKPDLKLKWENEIFPKFFVTDESNIDLLRKPGLFKAEAEIDSGSMVALRMVFKLIQIF